MAMMIEREEKFVVFEGVGGSGKTSQLPIASGYLLEKTVPHIVTREPGGVESAEHIRELIFKLKGKGVINADHQMALFFAARSLWVQNLVAPNLSDGKSVLSDRSYAATAAYQGYGEGGDPSVIEVIAREVMGEYMPNAIILLDISAETSHMRNANHKDGDPFDDEEIEYTRRVVDGYRGMAERNWSGVPWYKIDAEASIDDVSKQVSIVLNDVFGIK